MVWGGMGWVDVGWMWGGCGVDVGWMWGACGMGELASKIRMLAAVYDVV